ncbi:MAG: MarR family transcriptional regulator [bacterium]|nr:MarR family transcriptional regulator [bacterium]
MEGRSPTEGHLLSYLRSYAPCPVGALTRVFGIKGATLTGVLDRLEAQGLLERRIDPEDRRSFLVHLSDAGRSTADGLNRMTRSFERAVLRRIGDRDLKGFQAVVAAIAAETQVVVRPPTSHTPRRTKP